MDALRWDTKPQLRAPMMIAAFEGWTDAGGAATGAASYLATQWQAQQFADIDAEEFYDFTARRPQVSLDGNEVREIVWPPNRFLATSNGDAPDVVILIGTEPHLRWRTFCDCVRRVAVDLQVGSVFTLGSMLGDVAHTRPTPVRASSADPDLCQRLGMNRPQYQGPTGIIGVLQDTFAEAAIPVASIMGQVSHYVSNMPSPKATLAIVNRVTALLGVGVSTSELETAASAYERQVSQAVEADSDIAGYVRELEERADRTQSDDLFGDLPSGDALAAQLEQFLRDQDESSG